MQRGGLFVAEDKNTILQRAVTGHIRSVSLLKGIFNAEKLFNALDLPMPNGLKGALLSGKKFEYHDNKIIVRNIYEDGNWDSYKVQIEAL